MQLVYSGGNNPMIVEFEGETVSFVPNLATEVSEKIGKVLLENASDIFKELKVELEVEETEVKKAGKKKK